MKFKLIEKYSDWDPEDVESVVHEYLYDAINELKDAKLDVYWDWYIDNLDHYNIDPELIKTIVSDVYIEAIDCGKINRTKTMITSELTDYISANKHLVDNLDELINRCPDHLQHELKLVINAAELTESLNENKGETDKRLIVDVISNFNTVTVNGSEYVLHHINGKKEKPKDRVTSNYLLIPIRHNNLSGDEIHLGLHRIARAYKALDAEVSKLNEIPWLYVGTGHTLIDISAEEVVETLKKNLPEK